MEEPKEHIANIPPSQPPSTVDINALLKPKPFVRDSIVQWVDNAVQKTLQTLESTISITSSRLNNINSTSSSHLPFTFDSLRDLRPEYNVYEDSLFAKIEEGVCFAAAHPYATSGVVVGSGLLAVKRTRCALYYHTMRLFLSEEAMFSRANAKVQKLRGSFKDITEEVNKLEKRSLDAEAEWKRGTKKLRQAGKQIQGVINLAYEIERRSGGLKYILKELPKGDALQFRSEVLKLAAEAKRERMILREELIKISNYGIPV